MYNTSLVYSLGFVKSDLEIKTLSFPYNNYLSDKIGDVLYFGEEKSEQLKTRFYWINANDITQEEIKTIHERIWNENKSDLLFLETEKMIEVKYVNTSPKEDLIDIDSFPTTTAVDELLNKISKEHITTGAFWIKYYDALEEVTKQHQSVDQALVESLARLRAELNEIYLNRISSIESRDKVVQALIDRTLFIKFLEDKKIINSLFYQEYFGGKDVSYKTLLQNMDSKSINDLFSKINEIFNNKLFVTPRIEVIDLLEAALMAIEHSISGTRNGQLCLFDFQFDIIPIEFISHIYQIFLDGKKAEQGIFFTPKGLAEILIDNVIKESGTILDPSCGSGVFLVLAFRKMYRPHENIHGTYEKIQHRLSYVKNNIFGIELENTAARLAFFSLYLEVLNGITAEELNLLVSEIILEKDKRSLFSIDFSENIQEKNALIEEGVVPFEGKEFNYIIGNPPWFVINQNGKDENDIINYKYWNRHRKYLTRERQMSQCFLHRVKYWSAEDTRFGFIVNSSNFLNEVRDFQVYFFSNYRVLSFFELNHLKDILFDYAKEPACLLVFDNSCFDNNVIEYFLPKTSSFTDTFKTVLINEDEVIKIKQKDVLNQSISLRDYLIGTENELLLANHIEEKTMFLSDLIVDEIRTSSRGFEIWGIDALRKEFDKNREELTDNEYKLYKQKLEINFFNEKQEDNFIIPFVKSAQLDRFIIKEVHAYSKVNIENFHRPRDPSIYEGDKILCSRIGGELKAMYSKEKIYFASDIFVIKLKRPELYHTITCCLNSDLVHYYSQIKQRKRIDSALSRLNSNDLKKIPVPRRFDKVIVDELNVLSESVANGKFLYEDKKNRMNELVFDLYELNYIEKQRISDFFISENKKIENKEFEDYCHTFFKTFKRVLKTGILKMEYSYSVNMPFDIAAVKVIFGKNDLNKPLIEEVNLSLNYDLLKRAKDSILFSINKRIYSEDSIFIIKDNNPKNWSKSIAYDDAKSEIIKLLEE